MHTVHFLCVTADSLNDACTKVEDVLYAGPGDTWWDWFAIGGRWSGALDGADVVRVNDAPDTVREVLQGSVERQDAQFRETMRLLTGSPVSEDDAPSAVFGIPIEDTARWTAAENARIADSHQTWQRITTATSLQDIATDMFGPEGMLLWRLGKALELVQGVWGADSGFLWIGEDEHVSHPWKLLPLVGTPDAEDLYLVTVDFHF